MTLPCAVVIGLGLRTLGQERELAEKRLSDERARLEQDIGAGLAQELAEEAGGGKDVLALAIHEGSVQPPWQAIRVRDAGERFRSTIRRGETEEFARDDPTTALVAYRRAAAVAETPFETATALLAVARVQAKLARRSEAIDLYAELLETPGATVDEDGIPFALYAATRLGDLESSSPTVVSRLQRVDLAGAWLRPEATYMLRSAVGTLPKGDAVEALARRVDQRIDVIEVVMALLDAEQSGPGFWARPVPSDGAEPQWRLDAGDRWLVAALGGVEEPRVVIVPTAAVFGRVERSEKLAGGRLGAFRIVARGANEEPLDPRFPDLAVRFDNVDDLVASDLRPQLTFYLVTLLLVIALTLFGGLLLWRDVRRDVEMAEMRSQFVSSVSHELRTPLTSIRMFAETLRDRPSGAEAPADDFLEIIIGESERLTRLLDNVLNFSKIERGSKIYHLDSMRLEEAVESARRALAFSLEQHGFELIVDVEEGLPLAHADRDAIEQAVLNLLTNAVKYSNGERRIELCLRRDGQFGAIEVTDHGIGIRPEDRERIFEPFYRVKHPQLEHVPGTGLGLALVRHIADAHQGDVTVESSPGQGSTFRLRIPLEGIDA
ncbi:MAG: ATP-binding protein [Acidobacteria bacterium]|nr:ATP-binding protein [Acidobacteriota bacterium]